LSDLFSGLLEADVMNVRAGLHPKRTCLIDQNMDAALAEAWHLDGYHAAAAEAFAELAGSSDEPGDYALKAASSFYAAKNYVQGDHWFERARVLGAPCEQVEYLQGLRLWAQGDLARAIDCFKEARGRFARRDLFTPALAMLLARIGQSDKARALVVDMMADAPGDPYAAINLVSLDVDSIDFDRAVELLRGAARKLPQRIEPHLLYALLCRRRGINADDALRKTSLRKTYLGSRAVSPRESNGERAARAHLSGRLSPEGFNLNAIFRFDDPGAVPSFALVNRGYALFCQERLLSPVRLPEGVSIDSRLTPELAAYRLEEDMFLPCRSGVMCALELSGLPLPPAVQIELMAIELGEASAWLPILSPTVATSWTTDLSLGEAMKCFISSRSAKGAGIALLAVKCAEAEPVESVDTGALAVGGATASARRLAELVFARGCALWVHAIGPSRVDQPPLVVVNRDASTFCYAREGFVRVASGVLRDVRTAGILLHEAGHLWWGVDVRFEPDSQWLAESLAEYTLHLAERDGLLPGYASSSIAMLERLGEGRLPALGLKHLAARTDRLSAHLLRVVGGFVISALREVVGNTAFWTLLKALHDEESRHGFIDDYRFFALAARIYGRSLTWFVNQWVHTDSGLHLVAESPRVERVRDAYKTHFIARALGSATPGADVHFAVRTRQGIRSVALNLELGSCPATVWTPDAPLAIVPDADFRWPASRATTELKHAD
jgi:tetratricopeptide (TPR) repeat protein